MNNAARYTSANNKTIYFNYISERPSYSFNLGIKIMILTSKSQIFFNCQNRISPWISQVANVFADVVLVHVN